MEGPGSMIEGKRSLEQLLSAIGTTEHVSVALRDYPDRDDATEALEDDVAIRRRQQVACVQPHARAALSRLGSGSAQTTREADRPIAARAVRAYFGGPHFG